MFNIGLLAAKWARLTPNETAVIDATNDTRVNFADFDRRIRQHANALVGLGLAKGDRVAVLSQNSTEYLTVYLACARVGFVTQPMNWRLAAPELR